MYNHKQLTRIYERSRPNKFLGKRIQARVYAKPDTERGCFVMSEVYSKIVKDEAYTDGRYRNARPEEYDMRPFAEVYPDHIIIHREPTRSFLPGLFEVQGYKPKTNKYAGKEWHFRGQVVTGDLPLLIKDELLTTMSPVRARVVNNDLRIEMNRMVKKIRQLIIVRHKLGAFNVFDFKLYNSTTPEGRYDVLTKPERFLKLLQAVVPDDVKTFYPILWLAQRDCYWDRGNPQDWPARYEALIAEMKEKMRLGLGVVTYVPENELGTNSQDGKMEAA